MIVFDEDGAIVRGEPDLEAGYLTDKSIDVVRRWVVDAEEVAHPEIAARYPTGGYDIRVVVDSEERGHWETVRADDGCPLGFDPSPVPDDMPHDQELLDIEPYLLYVRYTDEELAEIDRAKADERERATFLANGPAQLAEADDAVCALYEQLIDAQAVIDEQDAAICALYEMTLRGGA